MTADLGRPGRPLALRRLEYAKTAAGALATEPADLGRPGRPLVLRRLEDAETAAEILLMIKALACDDSPRSRYPGPNPVSLDKSHFARIRGEPYYVCEKTDGVRYMLACCSPPGLPRNLCLLLDRALRVYFVPLRRVPTAAFQGTLLDGELAWNKATGAWEYLVFDALCVSGVPILNDALPARLDAVHRLLGVYEHDAEDAVRLTVKSFVSCARIADLGPHLAAVEQKYDVDGVILTPAKPGVVYGRHGGMFKLKPPGAHTVDFYTPDGLALCVYDTAKGAHVKVGSLPPARRAAPGGVVECRKAGAGWEVVGVRTDKTTANDLVTYNKTLINILENLDVSVLSTLFS